MADYVATLKNDLVEQFRGKANIEALMEVIGAQLQQVYDFYDQLRQDRGVHTADGKQLDGVGDIVVMTRMEAGKLAGYYSKGKNADKVEIDYLQKKNVKIKKMKAKSEVLNVRFRCRVYSIF